MCVASHLSYPSRVLLTRLPLSLSPSLSPLLCVQANAGVKVARAMFASLDPDGSASIEASQLRATLQGAALALGLPSSGASLLLARLAVAAAEAAPDGDTGEAVLMEIEVLHWVLELARAQAPDDALLAAVDAEAAESAKPVHVSGFTGMAGGFQASTSSSGGPTSSSAAAAATSVRGAHGEASGGAGVGSSGGSGGGGGGRGVGGHSSGFALPTWAL